MAEKLEIKKATIHFIYSFLPSTNTMSLKRGTIEKIYNLENKLQPTKTGKGRPEERIGISSYLTLDLDMGFLRFPELRGRLEDIDISIKPLIRLFPLGCSCCLSVSASTKLNASGKTEEIETTDVHKILQLVSQNKNMATGLKITEIQSDYYQFEKNKTTLFGLFGFITEQVVKTFNKKEEEEYKKDNSYEKEEIDILCKRKKYLEENVDEQYTPWVITVLELKGDSHSAFCGSFSDAKDPLAEKSRRIHLYDQEIAPILYKSPKGTDFHTEPAYINPPFFSRNVGFYNMNVDSRLFLHMSRRSILCLCGNQDKVPAQYFMPVLLDLCEMTHTRWHTLIILNKILDDSLKNFTGNMRPKERLERIMSLINKFTTCLEDPATYVVSGDALRKIHEELIDTYRLNNLSDVVLKKIEMLERYYKYKLESSWAEDL